jgi:hypothetical protein
MTPQRTVKPTRLRGRVGTQQVRQNEKAATEPRTRRSSGRLRHRPEKLAVCPMLCPNPSLHFRLDGVVVPDEGDGDSFR